jgi:hypothetical protein
MKWTSQQEAIAHSMRNDGATLAEIGKVLGRAADTVGTFFQRHRDGHSSKENSEGVEIIRHAVMPLKTPAEVFLDRDRRYREREQMSLGDQLMGVPEPSRSALARTIGAALILAVASVLVQPAHAGQRGPLVTANSFVEGFGAGLGHMLDSIGKRPRAWCGWEMRQLVESDPGPAFNLARNWAHYGQATTPHVGAIVVWPYHVGKIVGGSPGNWIITSGNDGHAVRTRPLSIAGAIAFRE